MFRRSGARRRYRVIPADKKLGHTIDRQDQETFRTVAYWNRRTRWLKSHFPERNAAMQGDNEVCIQAGMDAYLMKPIKLKILAEALSRSAQAREVLQIRGTH